MYLSTFKCKMHFSIHIETRIMLLFIDDDVIFWVGIVIDLNEFILGTILGAPLGTILTSVKRLCANTLNEH